MRSIRTKISLLFCALALVQYLGIAAYVYLALRDNLLREHLARQEQVTEALKLQFLGYKQLIDSYTVTILGDERIQAFLTRRQAGDYAPQGQAVNNFRSALTSHRYFDSGVASLLVLDTLDTLHSNDAVRPALHDYLKDLAAALEDHPEPTLWDTGYDSETIIVARRINDNKRDLNRQLGTLFLVIRRHRLVDLFQRLPMLEGYRFHIRCSGDRFFLVDGPDPGKDSIDCGVRGSGVEIDTQIDRGGVLRPVGALLAAIWMGLFLMMVLSFALILFLSRRITRPLTRMKDVVRGYGQGELTRRVPVETRDEIGELGGALNRMSAQIDALLRQNREEERQKRLLQLSTLQYQIAPHFLYNTLDSINMLARQKGDSQVVEVVSNLSAYFRTSLSQGRERITVREELDHVGHYLRIYSARFEHRFSYDIVSDGAVEGHTILKFILQPLVENSIVHGIGKAGMEGKITVEACGVPGNRVRFRVEDNGIGMTEERLEQVRAGLHRDMTEVATPADSTMYGLRNVYRRLLLHYGDSGRFEISSEFDEGTAVVVEIPLESDKEKERLYGNPAGHSPEEHPYPGQILDPQNGADS